MAHKAGDQLELMVEVALYALVVVVVELVRLWPCLCGKDDGIHGVTSLS
jgi:hypothetical protein